MPNRLKIIDASRGIAALVVVIHHFMVFNGNLVKEALSSFYYELLLSISNFNSEAVLFFFVISGFCIGLSLKGNLLMEKQEVKVYIIKRLFRILPIYFLALFASFLAGFIMKKISTDSTYFFTNLLGNLLFLQTPESVMHWFSPYGHNGPLWSLSYEMFFYLFFPVFSYILNKNSITNLNITSALLIMITIVSLMFNYFKLFTPWFSFLSLFIIWHYGYILLICYTHKKRYDFHFIIVFTASLLVFLNKKHIPSDSIHLIVKGLLMASALYGLIVIYRIEKVKHFLFAIERVLIFFFYQIGRGSYALYALHFVILMICTYFELTLIETLFTLTLTIICCIHLEKFLIRITNEKFNPNQLIGKRNQNIGSKNNA